MLKWITRIVLMLISSMTVRVFIGRVIDLKLSLEAQSKIKEGQTFREWFLYTRYRELIHPLMIVWYFANFIFCIVTAVISIVWVLIVGDNETITLVNDVFMVISLMPIAFVYVFIYKQGGNGFVNLVDRNKRYRKKKKKHPLQKKK